MQGGTPLAPALVSPDGAPPTNGGVRKDRDTTYTMGTLALRATAVGYTLFWLLMVLGAPANGRVALAVVGAAFVPVAVRAWRVALVVVNEGVIVRNLWRTRRFSWSDIHRFEVGLSRVGAHSFPNSCLLHAHDGRVIRVDGACASNLAGHRGRAQVQAIADELNGLVPRHSGNTADRQLEAA